MEQKLEELSKKLEQALHVMNRDSLYRDKGSAGMSISMTCKWHDGLPKTVTWTSGYPDESLEDILYGVYTCLIGLTWIPKSVLEGMREFAEDRLPEENYSEEDESEED